MYQACSIRLRGWNMTNFEPFDRASGQIQAVLFRTSSLFSSLRPLYNLQSTKWTLVHECTMKELPFKVKEVGPSEIRFFAMKASILCPFVDLNFHNFSQNHGSRCTIFPCLMGRNCYIGEIQPYILLQDNHSILITKTKPIKDELPVLLRCHITLSKAKSITLNSTLKKSHVSAFQWAD